MKRVVLISLCVLAGCAQTGVTNVGSLVGPVDLVMVDRLQDGAVDRSSGLVFVTSTDSSELRVFEPFRGGTVASTDWARAPDPLETLSIPTTDWADRLAVDEGRAPGRVRRTGRYVYAARRGGREVSVVSVEQKKTLALRVPLPAPMSAMTAWMELVDASLPTETALFVATWDGETGRVFRTKLTTNEGELEEALKTAPAFAQLAAFSGETIQALQVVPPSAGRTLDGAPFCATSSCLALATRAGRNALVDLVTGVSASLDFGGPVRDLAVSMRGDGDLRVYGVLDEEGCGGPACGGVLSVEIVTGTGGSFARSTDLMNLPMQPMRVGTGLITGLTIGAGVGAGDDRAADGDVLLAQGIEAVTDSGVLLSRSSRFYEELGAFSSSNGYVSFFDPVKGLLLDYDERRADVQQALVRRPGALADGGLGLIDADGGFLGSQDLAALSWAPYVVGNHSVPWREVTATTGGLEWKFEVFDGYLGSQLVYVVSHGVIPGLAALPTSDADGTHLPVTTGRETVALAGDWVNFFTGESTNGYVWCGRGTATAISAGFIDVDAVPAECAGRALFTVLAGTTQPWVLTSDLEGFMGRGEPGATIAYQRRMFLAPTFVSRTGYVDVDGNEYWAPREALKVTTPAGATLEESAAITFALNGYQTPYRVGVDVTSAGACYLSSTTPSQVQFGATAMGEVPWAQASSSEPLRYWSTISVVPSGNAVVTMRQSFFDLSQTNLLGSNNGTSCWQ